MVRDIETLCTLLAYIAFFWRIFKSDPGNRLVECGSMTVMIFIALIPLILIRNEPDWLFASWLILVVLLCFTTLFFVAQRGYRALRRRQKH